MWLQASKALKKEYQVYRQMIPEMAAKHSSDAFHTLGDPVKAAVFSCWRQHSLLTLGVRILRDFF